MSVALLVLLLLSAVVTLTALALTRLPRFRARYGGGRSLRTVGASQVIVGLLWAAWGAVYLGDHGRGAFSGWFVIALGALWILQGGRRLRIAKRRTGR